MEHVKEEARNDDTLVLLMPAEQLFVVEKMLFVR